MFKVIIDFDKCTGCGGCQSVCPADVYGDVTNGKIVVAAADNCIGCRACESQCPETAIVIEED